MASQGPVRLGVAGMGGYAVQIADLILRHGGEVTPSAGLVAVCDPALDAHAARAAELREQGVDVYQSYAEMLAEADLDGVWLPVPIPLHLPFAEQALEAGIGVMVEKPAAGCLDDVDAMIALRDRHDRPFVVGFQDVYDRSTLPLKRRILAGEFGDITHTTLHACWPRTDQYFTRAGWAGRVRVDDTWVLDSPANNALAHYVNIVLFLLGPTEAESARATSLEVELYRAAPIENFDTISARVHLDGGRSFLFLLTHACGRSSHPFTVFHGRDGRVTRTPTAIAIDAGGQTTTHERDQQMVRRDMLQRYARLLRGVPDDEIGVATLDVAREHTRVVSAASEAAAIIDVPEDDVEIVGTSQGDVRAIRGIEDTFTRCAERNQMLHESGLLPFTRPAAVIDLTGYTHFAGPKSHAPRTAPSAT